ncbi:MAG TPA: FHA domain-containing protein [Paucimonas sp.]|nr:FHA domain-containing protein [Paucimonas sp.]HJW56790.1 FHA domain-containing protein [Burkholderiaceae bacterium]
MAAKIIVTAGDTILQELVLSRERISIGRRPHNDVVLTHITISGEHAAIITMRNGNDVCLEDLDSTNGTQVNGQPVKKHFLQDRDVIELAHYRIRYRADGRDD